MNVMKSLIFYEVISEFHNICNSWVLIQDFQSLKSVELHYELSFNLKIEMKYKHIKKWVLTVNLRISNSFDRGSKYQLGLVFSFAVPGSLTYSRKYELPSQVQELKCV